MSAIYANPWFKPDTILYGPERYQTDAKPFEYRGFLIYERIKGSVWDVVLDDEVKAMRAGPRGAREAVDEMLDEAEQTFPHPLYRHSLEHPKPNQ